MKTKTRKFSIKLKIMLLVGVVVVLLVTVLGNSFYSRMESDMVRMGVEQAEVAARAALMEVDAELLKTLKPGDETSEGYLECSAKLQEMMAQCSVAYLYTLYTDGSQVYYGLDADPSESRNPIGAPFEVSYQELAPVFAGEPYVQDYIDSTEDGELISSYLPITDESGNVVAVLGSDYDAGRIVERLNAARMETTAIGAVSFLVALLLLNFVISGVLRNLHVVNSKLAELANNNGDLTQVLDVKSGDEMELVANNVNELLGYIREIMLKISHSSTQLSDSSKTIASELNSAEENIMDVSATMQEMSAAMEETSAALKQVNDVIDTVYNRINDIFEDATKGSNDTGLIQSKAMEIYQRADEEKRKALTLSDEMKESVREKIERSKAVSEINVLTENIIEITSQTNLLALNASIEAARAGEAGRGFAVVAGEIGNLATNSASAANRIQQVSREVVAAVEELAEESEKMLRFLEESVMSGYGQLLKTGEDYHKDAVEIHGMMERFAEASEHLEEAMDGIREAVSSINTAVDESTHGITGIAETSASLTENVGGIEKKADMNMQIAEILDGEVKKFKVE